MSLIEIRSQWPSYWLVLEIQRKKRQSSSSLEWGGDGFVVSREREDKRIKTIQEG